MNLATAHKAIRSCLKAALAILDGMSGEPTGLTAVGSAREPYASQLRDALQSVQAGSPVDDKIVSVSRWTAHRGDCADDHATKMAAADAAFEKDLAASNRKAKRIVATRKPRSDKGRPRKPIRLPNGNIVREGGPAHTAYLKAKKAAKRQAKRK